VLKKRNKPYTRPSCTIKKTAKDLDSILEKIISKTEELVNEYPSHLIDESLIKHKIIEVLISEIQFSFNIENLQSEKTCKVSNVNRCDIYYKHNNENVFLELKLNRLVLKLTSGKLTGKNVFEGDIIAILKDFEEMGLINNGKKYLLLVMQNQGIKIGNNYKLSINEYAEKKQSTESKKLIRLIENKEDNVKVLVDNIIFGKVNSNKLPFRIILFQID
jgi:hypothetical protein